MSKLSNCNGNSPKPPLIWWYGYMIVSQAFTDVITSHAINSKQVWLISVANGSLRKTLDQTLLEYLIALAHGIATVGLCGLNQKLQGPHLLRQLDGIFPGSTSSFINNGKENDCFHNKICSEIAYLSSAEVWKWVKKFIQHFTVY